MMDGQEFTHFFQFGSNTPSQNPWWLFRFSVAVLFLPKGWESNLFFLLAIF
jgi:hypothetical protein